MTGRYFLNLQRNISSNIDGLFQLSKSDVMTIDIMQTMDVIEAMENFLFRKRPKEKLRDQVDIAYKIDNQSVIIYEITPRCDNPKEIMESAIAKTTSIKAKGHCNVWLRSVLKWNIYQPKPSVKTIKQFVVMVQEDQYHCFGG
jgi:hypothetical protein